MSMSCANTYYLNQHQAKIDSEEGEARFIEEYVITRIEERIIENATGGDVLEAFGQEQEAIMEAYRQMLLEFKDASMSDKVELTAEQELTLTRFAWTFLKYTKGYLREFTEKELIKDAESALQEARERENCSCSRAGRECVC